MAKDLEDHMADFLIDQAKLGLAPYCRRCIEFWRQHYGNELATKVETIARAAFRKGPNDGRR